MAARTTKTKNSRSPRKGVNPIVEKLIRGSGGGAVSTFHGFIGLTTADMTRLYLDLSLAKYVDLSNASILHMETSEAPNLPATVYVRSRAAITVVHTKSMIAEEFSRRQRIPCNYQSFGGVSFRRRGPSIRVGPPGGGGECGDYARAAYSAMKDYEAARDAGDDQRASDALTEVLNITNEAVDAGCNPWAW